MARETRSPEPAGAHCRDRAVGLPDFVAAQPSSVAGAVLFESAGQAVSRSPKASGVMSMWSSIRSTLASLDNVASDGSWSPASSRAIAGWCMPRR